MKSTSIIGAGLAALGAAISGSVSSLVMDETSSVRRPTARRVPKRKHGDHSQLTNEQRKRMGLPHDGAKQAEKDRRREVWMEEYFDARFTDAHGWVAEPRAKAIVCRGA